MAVLEGTEDAVVTSQRDGRNSQHSHDTLAARRSPHDCRHVPKVAVRRPPPCILCKTVCSPWQATISLDSAAVQANVYGGTHELVHHEFPALGIKHSLVDPMDSSKWEDALESSTEGKPQLTIGSECLVPCSPCNAEQVTSCALCPVQMDRVP